jgi:Rieske Fe-S protein
MEELEGIDRRAFLTQGMIASAAILLAACGGDGGPTAPASVDGSIHPADFPALATVGGVALVSVSGQSLAIVRTGPSSFAALSRVCPHQGNTINPSGDGFLCTGHGARFSKTGTWVGGQPTSNMRSYSTQYDAATDTLTIG